MKIKISYLLIGLFLFSVISCDENLLEKEQYKKVIYLLSGDNNVFDYSHALNDSITRGYITVGSGGTLPLDKNIIVKLELDTKILEEYNYRQYDVDYNKYAKLLDSTCFVLPSFEIKLKAGDPNASTFFPIEVDANGLSPDTAYMVPLKIISTSDYEVNPLKSTLLYHIELQNKYSSSGKRSYSMRGTKQSDDGNLSAITKVKDVIPISKNRVRIFPENLSVENTLDNINDKTIILTVNDDQTIHVKPYKNIEVEPIGSNYYNEDSESFNLSYRYRLPNTEKWIYIEEILTRVK